MTKFTASKSQKTPSIRIVVSIGILLLGANLLFMKNFSIPSAEFGTTSKVTIHVTKATLCPEKTLEELKTDAKSQSNEDIILLRWFNRLCGGTYLEMGALNGLSLSNSYMYNKHFNWKGLLIEPNPLRYERLVHNRPNEIALVYAAVCDKKQMVHFVNKDAASGIYEFAAPSFRQKRWSNITFDSPDVIEITCHPLQTIIEEHVGYTAFFDFFSLDVKGAEFQVLESIDFDKSGFGIIFLEADKHNTRKNAACREYLFTKGYNYVGSEARSDWFGTGSSTKTLQPYIRSFSNRVRGISLCSSFKQ